MEFRYIAHVCMKSSSLDSHRHDGLWMRLFPCGIRCLRGWEMSVPMEQSPTLTNFKNFGTVSTRFFVFFLGVWVAAPRQEMLGFLRLFPYFVWEFTVEPGVEFRIVVLWWCMYWTEL